MVWTAPALSGAIALVITALAVPGLIRLGHSYGLLDMPGQHKRHQQPTPVLGGAALFIALWSAMAVAVVVYPETLGAVGTSLGYIFAGSLIIFLVGLSDDLLPLGAWVKLLAQVCAGVVLYVGGLRIDPLSIPFAGQFELGSWSLLITVVWVVILTNAINLIDGLDGLAGGVSLIAAIVLLVVGHLYSVGFVVVAMAGMAGFLAVFLWHNRPPARIFLGDNGSLQLGFYFAVVSLVVPIRSFTAAALYVPLLVLGVPLIETGASFLRRVVAGRSVMQADRRHLFHILALAGLSPGQIVGVFYILSGVFGVSALAMLYLNRRWVLGFLVLFMVVILVLFLILRANLLRQYRRRRNGDPDSTKP